MPIDRREVWAAVVALAILIWPVFVISAGDPAEATATGLVGIATLLAMSSLRAVARGRLRGPSTHRYGRT